MATQAAARAGQITVLTVFIIEHLFSVIAIWLAIEGAFHVGYLFLLLGGWIFTAFGITVGFHRMLTHRGFDAHPWLRKTLLVSGCMALQGLPSRWAEDHLLHHAKSDKDGDPHSPIATTGGWIRRFLHSHLLWMLAPSVGANPERQQRRREQDADLRWVEKYYLLWLTLSFVTPMFIAYAFGLDPLMGLLWGGFLRITLVHHITWSINSVCHLWGSHPYNTGDFSRNNGFVAFWSAGEGWHNNHHADQGCAFHGHEGQLDLSKGLILFFEKLGWAWNVRRENKDRLNRLRIVTSAQ